MISLRLLALVCLILAALAIMTKPRGDFPHANPFGAAIAAIQDASR